MVALAWRKPWLKDDNPFIHTPNSLSAIIVLSDSRHYLNNIDNYQFVPGISDEHNYILYLMQFQPGHQSAFTYQLIILNYEFECAPRNIPLVMTASDLSVGGSAKTSGWYWRISTRLRW